MGGFRAGVAGSSDTFTVAANRLELSHDFVLLLLEGVDLLLLICCFLLLERVNPRVRAYEPVML
jgi:hypothetical protein